MMKVARATRWKWSVGGGGDGQVDECGDWERDWMCLTNKKIWRTMPFSVFVAFFLEHSTLAFDPASTVEDGGTTNLVCNYIIFPAVSYFSFDFIACYWSKYCSA